LNSVKTKVFGVLLVSSILASCGGGGGGGDEELLRGVLSDSPVGGMNFITQSVTGVTDADGEFQYREGEYVIFQLGKLSLPAVVATDLVTPLDMVAEGGLDDPAVVNIARLLQSLDEDADPENGISIPDSVNDVFVDVTNFDATEDGAVEAAVEQVYGDSRPAVDADQAILHFVDTLSINAASNGTLEQLSYIVGVDNTFSGESLFVDQDTFAITLDGEVHSGTASINQGVYQLSSEEDTWFVSIAENEDKKLACVESVPTAIADCADGLYQVFTEETQAMAFNASQESAEVDVLLEPDTGAATEDTLSAGNIDLAVDQTTDELSLEELFPSCSDGTIDDDGDGYGWQNNQTCLIIVDGVAVAENSTDIVDAPVESSGQVEAIASTVPVDSVEEPEPVEPTLPVEEIAEVEEAEPAEVPVSVEPVEIVAAAEPVESVEPAPVLMPVAEVVTPEPEIIPDAETMLVAGEEVPAPQDADAEVNTELEPEAVVPQPVQPSDITDIIVLTGQSNAAGVQTDFDATLDAGNDRLFAFNEDGQWQTADLDQYWDENLPSNFASAADGREPFNNLVFQTGKSLTEQTDRVVGVILVTAPGEGISHWDYNSEFYIKIRNKVAGALAALPQKNSIDAMIWLQGETDWLAEGTADPGATGFASTDTDFYRNYYPNKLNQLISNLRSEWWFGATAQFICGETKKASLNPHLMALNNDGDDLTSCAQGSDLPTSDAAPFDNHYSAEGLRTLGDRVAALYLSAAD